MAALAERTGRRYHLVDYAGHPEAERVVVVMGSGGETARETVAALTDRGERVGVVQLRLYRPFPAQRSHRGAAFERAEHCRARQDQGAGVGRGAALPRHRRGSDGGVRRRRAGGDAPDRRRPLRAVVEGVHSRHGRGRLRRVEGRATAAPLHDRHHRRRLGNEPRLRRDARHRAARHGPRDLLRPGLGRDRRGEQEHDQDPGLRGGTACAGLFRLRLEEVRLADGVPSAVRSSSDPGCRTSSSRRGSSAATSSAFSTVSTCSAARRPARRYCSIARIRRRRSGMRFPVRFRSRS